MPDLKRNMTSYQVTIEMPQLRNLTAIKILTNTRRKIVFCFSELYLTFTLKIGKIKFVKNTLVTFLNNSDFPFVPKYYEMNRNLSIESRINPFHVQFYAK